MRTDAGSGTLVKLALSNSHTLGLPLPSKVIVAMPFRLPTSKDVNGWNGNTQP